MDRNTIIGFVLMGLVLFLFTWLGRPSQEELALRQKQQDSIVQLQRTQDSLAAIATAPSPSRSEGAMVSDSALQSGWVQKYGSFANAVEGKEEIVSIGNDSVRLSFSTKCGMLCGSELVKFQDYKGENVRLLREGKSNIHFSFITKSNRVINTSDLYFVPEKISDEQLRMSVTDREGHSLSLLYTLEDKYLLDVAIENKGLGSLVSENSPYLDMHVSIPAFQTEKSYKTEERYSGIVYEYVNGDVEKMSTSKDVSEDVSGKLKWVAYRNMFFSTIVYAPNGLERARLNSRVREEKTAQVKDYDTVYSLALANQGASTPFKIYIGPNDYTLLKSIDQQLGDHTSLNKIVDMGDWFRFINVWIVVPIFNFLERVFSNYGLIIFLLTLIIKVFLMPFTYKSYLSTAKMKVLRPQIEEINQKYAGEDRMMEKQRATMELYRRAGVSTMGGCLPMLLQMPFLIAMYQYFPTSINLRGESFLWAHDLSTYDDVIKLGVDLPLIGGHISLFCLLMTITQIVYMKISQANTPQAMPGMKLMPYFMSVMLFVFLNQNAAGLSYYYLLSMLITIVQTLVFRYAINDEKLLAQLEVNKKKPMKKSKFMQRLEEMQKQQAEMQRQNRNRKK